MPVSPRCERTNLWTSLLSWINLASQRAGGEGFMGIWTSAFLCALCRLTWLPLACTARVIWIRTHHVSCTHSSKSLTSLSLSPSLSLSLMGEAGFMWRVGGCWGGSWVAAGCFVCSWVSGYPACPALVLPGHVSHRLSLLFTFLMRGAGLCDMWLTAGTPPPPPPPPPLLPPGLWLFGSEGGQDFFSFFLTYLSVFLWEVSPPLSSWTLLLWAGLVEREDCGSYGRYGNAHSCLTII